MGVNKSSERQYPLSTGFLTVDYTSLQSGVAIPAFDIPYGAVITGGEVIVDTAWNSATSDVLDVGDGADDNRYTSTQINLAAVGRTALTLTGYMYTAADTIDLKWTGAGAAPSQGSMRIRLEYVLEGRGNENYR